jgi:hypothetical protein
MIGYLENFLFETKKFIVLDANERWFRFDFSIVTYVDNLDKDIRGLFFLILYNDIDV